MGAKKYTLRLQVAVKFVRQYDVEVVLSEKALPVWNNGQLLNLAQKHVFNDFGFDVRGVEVEDFEIAEVTSE